MKHEQEQPERCFVCGAPTRFERVLLSISQATRLCRISRATVYRWMEARTIEWVVLPYGMRRIYLDSLFHDRPRRMDAIL